MGIASKVAIGCSLALALMGCSTSAEFRVPPNSKLYINHETEPVEVERDGEVTTRPYGWNCTAGIPYRLEKEGGAVQEGTVAATFRPASIFWPPYALIYWPMGFRDEVYDLTKAQPATAP